MTWRILARRAPAPLDVVVFVAAATVGAAAIAYPLSVTRYPPMVDLPFHAAQASALAHYFDPSFGFREQFELRPFAVPYVSMYALAAALMTVLPVVTAVKMAAGAMLALLPAGLAVLFHGMKKSPLLGLAGLVAVWCPLTHWGFLNFMGALGLFAMVVGLALLVVDEPTPGRRVALLAALVALFFTHVYRYPFALAAVAGVAIVVGRRGRGLLAVAPALLPAGLLFALWLRARPASLQGQVTLALDRARLADLPGWLWGSFEDPAEPRALAIGALVLAGAGGAAAILRAIEARRLAMPSDPSPSFRVRAAVVALGAVLASLALYLTLPMSINDWWYVYPREATAACFLGLALLPDLPRARGARLVLASVIAAASLPMVRVVARNYAVWEPATREFDAAASALPQAPKLLYLVFDHEGSSRTVSPFTHLPAWVQADRGGALSYHFAKYGASPLAYRAREGREDVVPPPTPPRWEVTPEAFDVTDRGRFFDWFLVRRRERPDAIFEADPSIVLEASSGSFWLYRRLAPSEQALARGEARAR